jgi:pullulanase
MKKTALAVIATALMIACEPQKEQTFSFDEMTYSPSETVFKLFAPAEASCFVVVGDDTIAMEKTAIPDGAIFTATVKGDQKGKTYVFVVDGQASPGVFAKAVTVNGQKGVIVDLRDTDPEGWDTDNNAFRKDRAFSDWIVYEMHHRDFSVARPDAENPGKFLALTEPWAIGHLTDLGINAVHILPSYDYGSVDETRIDPDLYYEHAYEELPEGVIPAEPDFSPQYNWGYDPVNYNVPEGSYSTDPYDPQARIREFKQMVQALHKAGIAVVLDVVYNHTFNIDNSNFQRTFPDYYYRKNAAVPGASPSGYSNGSGCGNETASEKPMMRKFMIESVKYWVNEYHIDGFRFDLMGVHDIETMNAIRAALDEIDPNILIYGEGWSAGSCAIPNEQLGMKANIPQMPRIAAFSDDLRDALRGPFSDDTKGAFLAALPGSEESIEAGIAGMIEHPQVDYAQVNYSDKPYAIEPTQMMAYVSCHDDLCLVDRLKSSIPAINQSQLIKLDLLAQTAVFTSQGIPFMLSGEELLRDKKGVHNSYESPDSINQLNWQNKERYPQVFNYYKNLIALRKNHPAFRLGNADLVRQHLQFLPADDCLVAFCLKDNAGGDQWQNIYVILNANTEPREVTIPEGSYTVVCANGQINEQGIVTVAGPKVIVDPQSALILHN